MFPVVGCCYVSLTKHYSLSSAFSSQCFGRCVPPNPPNLYAALWHCTDIGLCFLSDISYGCG